MGACCPTSSSSGCATAAFVEPAVAPHLLGRHEVLTKEQQQHQQLVASVPHIGGSAIGIAAVESETRFAEFEGRGLAVECSEIVEAADMDNVKSICIKKSYAGFTIRDGKAHFHTQSVKECLQMLSSEANATFFASAAGGSANEVSAMTYNVFWWNLYGERQGNNASASRLIADAMPDLIGFQECDDVSRVLHDANLQDDYKWIQGPAALAIAYNHRHWSLLSEAAVEVAVDEPEQFYGKRYLMHSRLQNTITSKTMVFACHHGPLRVNSGGRYGGLSTANNILNAIAKWSQPEDSVILVGDINATPGSETILTIEAQIPRAFTGVSFGGVDSIFSNLPMISGQNLGDGGSDHDALIATFRM